MDTAAPAIGVASGGAALAAGGLETLEERALPRRQPDVLRLLDAKRVIALSLSLYRHRTATRASAGHSAGWKVENVRSSGLSEERSDLQRLLP